jgi:hypothetical protein
MPSCFLLGRHPGCDLTFHKLPVATVRPHNTRVSSASPDTFWFERLWNYIRCNTIRQIFRNTHYYHFHSKQFSCLVFELLGSNLRQIHGFLDWWFSLFSSVPPGKCSISIRRGPLSSKSFPIHNAFAILTFDVKCSYLFTLHYYYWYYINYLLFIFWFCVFWFFFFAHAHFVSCLWAIKFFM